MCKLIAAVFLFLFISSATIFADDDKLVAVGGVDPSAVGDIHTDTDKNGNIRVKIDVEHLADPEKLVPPHRTYFAWIQAPGAPPQPLGEIRVDEHQKGSVSGTSPAKIFDVFITAEDSPTPTSPSSTVVLKGHVEHK